MRKEGSILRSALLFALIWGRLRIRMATKKRILAISDYAMTGIGESLRNPLKHWHETGHEVWYLGLGYNGWFSQIQRDIYPYAERILPMMDQFSEHAKFGQQSIVNALKVSQADHVITSFDVGMIRYLSEPHRDPIISQNAEAMQLLNVRHRSFSHIAYVPLDGATSDGTMPRYFDEVVSGFDVPVTYSEWAKRCVLDSIGIEIPMIPISHDPKIYYPKSKRDSRSRIGFPDHSFIISMVGTNQSRKDWPAFFAAAARVAKRHSDVLILPWTTWAMQINGGYDIEDLIYRHDIQTQVISPGEAVHRFTDEQMADLYSAVDVLVLTTVGEGAGLPPIRARACGTPALVSANTACIEYSSDDFELVSSFITHTDRGNNLVRYGTNVDDLEAKLERLYSDRKFLKDLGKMAHQDSKQYETSVCNAEWDALLEAI